MENPGDSFVQKNEYRAESLLYAAQDLHRQGKLEQAVEVYRQSAEANPNNFDCFLWLGRALLDLKRFDEAETAFLEAGAILPTDGSYLFELGGLYCQKKEYDKAYDCYAQSGTVGASTSRRYNSLLGMTYVHLSRREYDETIEVGQRAMRLGPSHPYPYYYLALAHSQLKRFEEAEGYIRACLRIDPEFHGAVQLLAWVLTKLGKGSEGEAILKGALRKDPNDALSMSQLASVYYAMGRYDEGVEVGYQVVKLQPENAIAKSNLAESLVKLGRDEEAISFFQQAYSIDQTPMVGISHYGLGLIALENGDQSAAAEHFRECLKIEADHAGALKKLAKLAE